MTTETKTLPDAAILSANLEKARTAASDMEFPVADVEHAGEAIILAATGMGEISGNDKDVEAFHFLGEKLKETAAKIGDHLRTVMTAMHACIEVSDFAVEDAASLSREWREVYDRVATDRDDGRIDDHHPDFERLEALEEAIRTAPIRGAHDALAKLRQWAVYCDGKGFKQRPATVADCEAEALDHSDDFGLPDELVAQVFAWLHAICEGQSEEGGAS